MHDLALIEVEAMAKKAAHGAGHSWGMAEEAGKAARWLCAVGCDGVGLLARTLIDTDPKSCPLRAGTTLSDFADRLVGEAMRFTKIREPLMLLPFAASAARKLGRPVSLTWDRSRAVTDGKDALVDQSTNCELAAVSVQIDALLPDTLQEQGRATPNAEDWAVLTELAARTYAPATEESRLKGAGAGLRDND